MLTVLSVAYPLAPVRPDTSGGAEQVLAMLDEALVAAGHRSIVVAAEGSRVRGTLIPVPRVTGRLDAGTARFAHERTRDAIRAALLQWPVDVVHMHGQDFHEYLPEGNVPVLVTLHVPQEWYNARAFDVFRPATFFNCVSHVQSSLWMDKVSIAAVIENGVPVDRLTINVRKRDFALALGRVSPEKGFHLALEAAELAGVQLLIAGEVYHYPEHERYFREQILPRVAGSQSRYLGPVGFRRKRRLLTAAQCVLLPSQVPETSSLVAMEALACGTPVVAFPVGALPVIVEHGVTGFLVTTAGEMAIAIRAAQTISPATCRAVARRRFDSARTVARYFALYEQITQAGVSAAC